jgi:hypothetical protein
MASLPKQVASQLRLAMIQLSSILVTLSAGEEGVHSTTMGLALLVDHVSERHPAFETWLSETLRRAHARFPRTDPPPEQEPLVPRIFFSRTLRGVTALRKNLWIASSRRWTQARIPTCARPIRCVLTDRHWAARSSASLAFTPR